MAAAQYFDWRFPASGASLGASLYERLPESTGTVYYVRTDGNNANNGLSNTAGGAWATYQYALDNAPGNSIVKIGAGTYAEEVTFDRGFSSSTVVTVEAQDPANKPTISSMYSSGSSTAFWRFRNLIFDPRVTSNTTLDCVKITGTTQAASDIELYGCVLTHSERQGYNQQGDASNIHVINCLIEHSGFSDPDPESGLSHTMYMRRGDHCMFLNCIVHHAHSYSFNFNTTSTGTNDNIVANCVFDSSVGKGGINFFTDGAATHLRNIVKNCISVNHDDWGVRSSCVTLPGTGDENIVDELITFGNGSGASSNDGTYILTNHSNTDPLFVDSANGDYHLDTGSPAIGAGDPDYTPTFDFDGDTRSQADLGAYRYGG